MSTEQIEVAPQSNLKRPRSRIKLAVIFVVFLFLMCIIICGATIYLYPRLGGEWASLKIIPNPPNSRLIFDQITSSSTDLYEHQIAFYRTTMSLQEMRNWYRQHVPMGPIDGQISDSDTRYSNLPLFNERINEYFLLELSASIAFSVGYWEFTSLPCFSLILFTQDAFESSDYFEHYFSNPRTQNRLRYIYENDTDTIVVIKRCWPAD